jgi:MFS family permease
MHALERAQIHNLAVPPVTSDPPSAPPGRGSGAARARAAASARHPQHQDGAVAPGDIAVGVIVGRAAEYFEFFVYGIASVLVFPALFFPGYSRLDGTLLSFAVFALGFVARPFGTLAGMALQRAYGRTVKLITALMALGSATCAMALLPGAAQIGLAGALLLAGCRTLQGLAVGASWDGLPSLLALHAPPHRRGWYAMLGQLGAPLGLALAAALYAVLSARLSEAELLDWGWRFPFFAAFGVNVVALFARLQLVMGDDYSQALRRQQLLPSRLAALGRPQQLNILLGAFAALASFALVHLVTVFPLSWIHLRDPRAIDELLWLQAGGSVLAAAGMLLSGMLADRIGRRTVLSLAAVAIGGFGLVAPWLLGGGVGGQNLYFLLGFALFGLSYGQAAGALANHFRPEARYLGAALSADMAWLFGAAFAPIVTLWLSTHLGLAALSGYLLSGMVGTLLALQLGRVRYVE